ncbi:MAG: type restriction-modification system methyltransferase subunit [Myxococcales bacterium]|nr:type restriction-modification system methyltransferase subunit [Myxococcales bacterium]
MAVTRDSRTDLGVVYTPREVCEPMVRRALEPLLAGRSRDEILTLRICDPAIGEGAFLIEIVRVLAEAIEGADARVAVAEQCIHGIDVDARAVAVARQAIERFVGGPVPALQQHLRVGDALTCTWPVFDAVVGNPPYVRQERLGEQKPALRKFAAYDGVADLYVYFIELAHRITRAGGRYCLVVPNKWMTAAYGRPLREFLAAQASVEGVVDFGRALPLFGDADAFPCIVWGIIGAPATEPIRAARSGSSSVARALAEVASPQARERWRDGPWNIDAPGDADIIDRWAKRWPALGDLLPERPSRGVVTGCNRAFVIDLATRARILDEEPEAATLIRPFVKGRDVRRWKPAAIDRYILLVDRGTSLETLPRVAAHLAQFRAALEPKPAAWQGAWHGRKPGAYRWCELQDPVGPLAKSRASRLLYQDIQTAPACSLDESGDVVPDTTVWILPTADKFLLAVLNSPIYGWYARRRFPPALNGAVRPKLEYMRALPIATPSPALRAKIVALVEDQLAHPDATTEAAIAAAVCDAYEMSPEQLQ